MTTGPHGAEHQDLEHEDRIIGRATALRSVRAGKCPDQWTPKNLELDQTSMLQRVELLREKQIQVASRTYVSSETDRFSFRISNQLRSKEMHLKNCA
jgi:hypothetical protein